MNRSLLAVEDNQAVAKLISNVGIEAGYDTFIANNESEFMATYKTGEPDVIVLDILMPGMDGFEVLRFLQSSCCKSRIVIVSGDPDFRRMAEDIGNVYGLSIDANISKPFRIVKLREILESIKSNFPEDQQTPTFKEQNS